MTAPAAPAALPDSVISYIESLEGRVAELAKAAKPDTAKADAPKADAPAAGAVPAEVVEYVDALEDENDALLAALAEAAPDHPLVTGNAPAAPADAAAAAPGAPVSKADPATPAVPALDAPVDPNTPAAAAVATPAPELADPALADAISKADPAVQAAFAAAAQAVADANERAAAAAAQAEQTAIVAKAEQLAGLGNPAELASLLGEISKSVSPQTAAKLDEILHTAEVQISKSQMFGEIGTAGAPTTISKSAETAAAELRKSDPSLTEAQALARVYEQNPDLYTATLDEQEL